MTIFRVTTEIEADNLTQAWAMSSQGHPGTFEPSENWAGFKSFRIEEVSRTIELTVGENEK